MLEQMSDLRSGRQPKRSAPGEVARGVNAALGRGEGPGCSSRVDEVLPRHRYALGCPCSRAACLRASCRSLPTLPMERPIVVAISE